MPRETYRIIRKVMIRTLHLSVLQSYHSSGWSFTYPDRAVLQSTSVKSYIAPTDAVKQNSNAESLTWSNRKLVDDDVEIDDAGENVDDKDNENAVVGISTRKSD